MTKPDTPSLAVALLEAAANVERSPAAHDVAQCLASFDPRDVRTLALVEGWLIAARRARG